MSKESREERRLRRLDARVERDEDKLAIYRKWAIWGGGAVILALLAFGVVKLVSTGDSAGSAKDITPAPIAADDWILGPDNAPYTLLEYSDFECPACRTVQPFLKEVLAKMPDQIRFVYRHFPLKQVHVNSSLAAEAAEAAGRQGKFWEMHDILFDKQDEWARAEGGPTSLFEKYAAGISLDMIKYRADSESKDIIAKINASYDTALRLGLDHTPTFFLNGRTFDIPRDANDLETRIKQSGPLTQPR